MEQMNMGKGGGGMPNMGGATGGDSDDEEGEEAQVEPHLPGDATKEKKDAGNLDDLDGDEENDLKK